MVTIKFDFRASKPKGGTRSSSTQSVTPCLHYRVVPSRPPGFSVFEFMRRQMERKQKMKRTGTFQTYRNAVTRFREFRKKKDLTFEELTDELIEDYQSWLVSRGLKKNTIAYYLRMLRTLYHRAVNAHLTEKRPIFQMVQTSFVKTQKRAISIEYVRAIEQLKLPKDSSLAWARDMFLFSFYMRGMPFVDMAYLKKSDLHHGMISYCRKKTNQELFIEWERPIQAIVDRYASLTKDSPYMLPILTGREKDDYRRYRQESQNVNRSLKKIGAMAGLKIPLTLYVARHTWASIARNMNVPLAVISEGMGHSSYRTTQVYLNTIDTSMINKANRKIMEEVFQKQKKGRK